MWKPQVLTNNHGEHLLCSSLMFQVYEKKRNVRWKYDLGWKQNFVQVKHQKYWWFFSFMYTSEENKFMHWIIAPTADKLTAVSLFWFPKLLFFMGMWYDTIINISKYLHLCAVKGLQKTSNQLLLYTKEDSFPYFSRLRKNLPDDEM